MRDRKGQVTMFIVLGIIILLAVGLFFVMRTTVQEAQTKAALKQDSAEGDNVVVQNFVSLCLEDVTTDALILLGQQGGYIALNRTDIHNREFVVQGEESALATATDTVALGNVQVPYWWYQDGEEDCLRCSITTKNLPSEEVMQEQISAYVEENINNCVDDFASLQEQGFSVVEQRAPTFETIFTQNAVYVQASYPIEISKEGVVSQLENWYVEVDVPLKEIYDAAVDVVSLQIQTQFLEQVTSNIISSYSAIDQEHLPPISGFTEGYAVVYWTKNTVAEQLQQYLNTYVPLLQIEGFANAEQLSFDTAYGEGFSRLLFRENDESFKDLELDFIYNNFGMYMDITPRTGELVGPQTFTQEFPLNILPPIQTNHYRFFYDISYPTIVSLRSADALQGQGYTFMLAMEANIRDNRNMMEWAQGTGTYGPWDQSRVEIGIKSGVETTYPAGFDLETNETIYKEFEEPAKTLLCEEEQRISGDVTVAVFNGHTGEPLPNAAVAFKCGAYRTCSIGATGPNGEFVGKLPICVGGAVRVDAQDYHSTYVDLDTYPDQQNNLVVLVEPIKEVTADVKFIPTARLNESLSPQALRNLAFDMSNTDSVLLTLEKEPDHIFDSPYTQVATITKDEENTLRLVSGTYSVSALLMDNDGFIISARNETIGGEEIEYPEVNMTPALLGSVTLDAQTGEWEVGSDLHASTESIFYVFRMNEPHMIEELGELGNMENYSLAYRPVVEPILR